MFPNLEEDTWCPPSRNLYLNTELPGSASEPYYSGRALVQPWDGVFVGDTR